MGDATKKRWITITVPFEERGSTKPDRAGMFGTEDGRSGIYVTRSACEVSVMVGDIHEAVSRAWPVGRELTDRAKRLAEIKAREAAATKGPWRRRGSLSMDSCVESEVTREGHGPLMAADIDGNVAGDGVARANADFIADAREDVPWMHREIREADAALAALGFGDDGRPLAERIGTLRTTLLATADELSRRGGRADERPDDYHPGEVYRYAAILLRDATGLIDGEHVPQLRGRVFLEEENARLRAEIETAHAALDPIVSRRDAHDDPPLSLSTRAATAARIAQDLVDDRDRTTAPAKREHRVTAAVAPEPRPIATGSPPVWPLVIADAAFLLPRDFVGTAAYSALLADMRARDAQGRERYGTPLTADNGRNHFVDGYQELLDGAVYLRAEIEADGPMAETAQVLYPVALRALARASAAMRSCGHRAGGEATTPGTCADCGVDFADLEDEESTGLDIASVGDEEGLRALVAAPREEASVSPGTCENGNPDSDPREGPMHDWFELSRASHLVLPRVIIQSMPRPWQAQLVRLLDRARAACEAAGVELAGRYYVRALDSEGRFTDEDLPHYRRAPVLGDPGWAHAPRATRDEDDPVEQEREEAATEAFAEAIRLVEGLKGRAVSTPEEMRQAALVVLTTRSPALAELAANPARRAAFNAVSPALAALHARQGELGDQIDAYEHADPPALPPEELVREYREVGEQIRQAEREAIAALGPPRIVVTPVAPIERRSTPAFVDGPGHHGVGSVTVLRYPESPRGVAMRELRLLAEVKVSDLSRALRIDSAEVHGLERGRRTTDDAGWMEITTTLFRLGSGTPAEEIADPIGSGALDRALAKEDEPGERGVWAVDDLIADIEARPHLDVPMPPPEPDVVDAAPSTRR